MVWGEYVEDGPDWDFATRGDQLDESTQVWQDERAATDERIEMYSSLDEIGLGNQRGARWNVLTLIGGYARHNGHADIFRERWRSRWS